MRKVFYSLTGLLAAGGLVLLGQRFMEGMSVTGLTSTVPWGLWISLYIYFVGLSAGSFLLSTLIYVFGMKQLEKVGRISLLAAIISLISALLFVWIDLGHPFRALRILVGFNTSSVMSWEFLFYMAYIVVMTAELWLLMRRDLSEVVETGTGAKRMLARLLLFGYRSPVNAKAADAAETRAHQVVKVLGLIGLPLAIGVHGGTGALFGVVAARSYWFSGLFPILFIVSALASGAALMTFLYTLLGRRDADFQPTLQRLSGLMILFIMMDALMVGAEFLVHMYGGHAIAQSSLLSGRFAWLFWGGEVGLAVLVPVLLVAASKMRCPVRLGLAGLSMMIGIIFVRINLVVPAYTEPVIHGLDKAIADARFSYSYVPTMAEAGLTVGLIALMIFLFAVLTDLLPFRELRLADKATTLARRSA